MKVQHNTKHKSALVVCLCNSVLRLKSQKTHHDNFAERNGMPFIHFDGYFNNMMNDLIHSISLIMCLIFSECAFSQLSLLTHCCGDVLAVSSKTKMQY